MSIFSKKSTIVFSLLLLFSQAYSQRMIYDVTSDSTIFLKAIYNEDGTTHIDVNVDGAYVGTIAAGGSLSINKACSKYVKAGSKELWRTGDSAAEGEETYLIKSYENQSADNVESHELATEISSNSKTEQKKTRTKKVPINRIVSLFKEYLEKDPFYSPMFVQSFMDEVGQYTEALNYIKDLESREEYIRNRQLREYLSDKEAIISRYEDSMDSFVGNFVASNFNANELSKRSEYETKLKNILEEKIAERKDVLDNCRGEILDEDISTILTKRLFSVESVFINVVLGTLITCIVILIIWLIRKSTRKKRSTISQEERVRQNANPDIVVRRKTTSILKKQSLEDVHHNPAYFPINSTDFCSDSAVRRIYLKNTCIKDIYNLYAEDLRNPENPNEDGCMVLGRWVHDNQSDEYYVSLEEIVKPGDDAIFKEYELNFGGKIKLKVSEKLRRLRRETNLQYDMTCWVHSHPGLGVFFSNADSNVQMQLKHPIHPKFLVAIVIDILTPNQELGIFTFKHDSDLSINSKADLRKMYSLEELHKWAVESDRTSFKQEDYRNIMRTASNRIDSHYGVELSNGAIIDMCQLQTTHENGLLAWVHGYTYEKNGKTEYILKSVLQTKHSFDDELIGCYINGSHCSIPTIKRVISNDFSNIRFILFYSTADGILTSIPVVNGQISVDEAYYGEEKLEDLKIWTRRKR